MKKLLDITRNGGYPLCAETLELLHDNVQLLETVLNGLKLPQHTIVRFPYGDYAYVQSCNPEDGNGEILKITSGNSLLNSNVNYYTITSTQQSVTNANNSTFNNVYEMRSLNLQHINAVPSGYIVKVYNCDEVFQLGLWKNVSVLGYCDRGYNNVSLYITPESEVIKYNDSEIRIRICVSAVNLQISANSELIIQIGCNALNNIDEVFAESTAFNSTVLNRNVTTHISRRIGYNRIQVKIYTNELYGIADNDVFTGKITVNTIIAL